MLPCARCEGVGARTAGRWGGTESRQGLGHERHGRERGEETGIEVAVMGGQEEKRGMWGDTTGA